MAWTSPLTLLNLMRPYHKVYGVFGKEMIFYCIDFITLLILRDRPVPQHLGSVRESIKKLVYNR